jgi:hypothetical protein
VRIFVNFTPGSSRNLSNNLTSRIEKVMGVGWWSVKGAVMANGVSIERSSTGTRGEMQIEIDGRSGVVFVAAVVVLDTWPRSMEDAKNQVLRRKQSYRNNE